MKTAAALLSLVFTVTLSFNAAAQDVVGNWDVESINSIEPAEEASLHLAFGENKTLTMTYTLDGEPQSWKYTYAVSDGQITFEPITPFGEPKTVTYDIKFDEGKLLLLTPKPKSEEEEEEEEEDTRLPVWVLVKA